MCGFRQKREPHTKDFPIILNHVPSKKTGLARLWAAFFNSFNGLRFAVKNEEAFRQEISLYILLLILLFFLPISLHFKTILFVVNTIVLLIELINSAIEAIVDMVSPEYNELAKHAKDLGSAAVLVSLILAIVLWGFAVSSIFMNIFSF
jgi:diacylglycerol kinase (ATP)